MAPAFLSTFMQKNTMSDYLELRHDEWNNVVDDETQCMVISREEEITHLSKQSKNRTLAPFSSLRRLGQAYNHSGGVFEIASRDGS